MRTIVVGLFSGVILLGLGLSTALAQDNTVPASPPLREGWNFLMVQVAAGGCTQSVMARAKEDFQKKVKQTGRTDLVFPKDYESEVNEMCQCVVRYCAIHKTFQEVQADKTICLSYMLEAFRNRTCTGRGRVGKEIEESLEREQEQRAFDSKQVDPKLVRQDLDRICAGADQMMAKQKSPGSPLRCDQVYSGLADMAKTETLKTLLTKILPFADAVERRAFVKAALEQTVPGIQICDALPTIVTSCQ